MPPVLLLLLIICAIAFISIVDSRPAYKVAYIGMGDPNSAYNKFNKWTLKQRLEEINNQIPEFKFELLESGLNDGSFYAPKNSNGTTREFYKKLKQVDDVVLVVDNTWGKHLAEAADIIRDVNLPVVALNGDKGGGNFGKKVVFLGSDDYTPEILINFLSKVIESDSVIFVSEKSYRLSSKFAQHAKNFNLSIDDSNSCYIDHESDNQLQCLPDTVKESGSIDVFKFINKFVEKADKDGKKRPVLLLNVHSSLGKEIISRLDSGPEAVLGGLSILGGAYVVGSKDIRPKNIKLFILTTPQDAMSNTLRLDNTQFFEDHEGVINENKVGNVPLFSERIYITSEIIKLGVLQSSLHRLSTNASNTGNSRKISPISAEQLTSIFSKLLLPIGKPHRMVFQDRIYNFDSQMRLKRDTVVELRHKGAARTYVWQLNSDYEIIPNNLFRITNLKVKKISQKSKTFTADFFLWVHTPCMIFNGNECKHNNQTITLNQSAGDEDFRARGERSGGVFGSLARNIRFGNLKRLENAYLQNYNDDGEVYSYLFRVVAEFNTQFKYRSFPLDQQELSIDIVMTKSPSKLKASHDMSTASVERSKFLKAKNISGWAPLDYYFTVDHEVVGYPIYQNGIPEDSNEMFQSVNLRIPVKRLLLKPLILVITPILMIGLAAISILYLRSLSFEGAGEVSVVIFLALITYSLSIVDVVPAIETATKAHVLFFITFALVVLMFLYIVYRNSYLVPDGSVLDKSRSRMLAWTVTTIYLIAVVVTILYY